MKKVLIYLNENSLAPTGGSIGYNYTLKKGLQEIDNEDIVRKQIRLFREEGFPEHYGLTENSIIYRNHKSDKVISIMEEWWHFVKNYSKRDQLSLFYILWKNNMKMEYLTKVNPRLDSKNFKAFKHEDGIISIEYLYKKYRVSL